jgi:hypothetical protein
MYYMLEINTFPRRLQSIAALLWTIRMVARTYYMCMILYIFVSQLRALKMQRCKERLWKLCLF